VVVPWYVWPFVGLGLFGRRRDPHGELLVAVPVVLTSVAIARIVAADPRTQLFIVPLVLLFAARGIHRLGDGADGALAPDRLRPGFARRAVFAIVVAVFFATSLRWMYMGATLGSPHHLVGAANREVGSALQRRVPPDEPVMSWHPAIAIYADRDWRVLPLASLPEIVRYANAVGSEYIAFAPYYPGPRLLDDEPDLHVLLRVPAGTGPVTDGWQLRLEETGGPFVLATLHPDPTGTGGEDRE